MSVIVRLPRKYPLTPQTFAKAIEDIKLAVSGRVQAAYVFGSAGTSEMTIDSDIDLLLVTETCASVPFVERGMIFKDLYDIFPSLDLLVYTREEVDAQLADADVGFWKSIRSSMKQII